MNRFQLPLHRRGYQMRAIPPIENDQNEATATRTEQFRGARTSVLLTFDFKLLTSLPLRAPKCARMHPDAPSPHHLHKTNPPPNPRTASSHPFTPSSTHPDTLPSLLLGVLAILARHLCPSRAQTKPTNKSTKPSFPLQKPTFTPPEIAPHHRSNPMAPNRRHSV